MPMTNPMDGLQSFQQAYRRGLIQVHRTATDKVFYHEDQPEGEPRLTFARIEGDLVTGIAQIVLAEPYEGERCFGLGYAVRASHRGRGIATSLAQVAITEFARMLGCSDARMLGCSDAWSRGSQPSSTSNESRSDLRLCLLLGDRQGSAHAHGSRPGAENAQPGSRVAQRDRAAVSR